MHRRPRSIVRKGARKAGMLFLLAVIRPAPNRAAEPPPAFVQAVEFPYYAYPRPLWERELVWLKNIGVQTVEFSIPWGYHQAEDGEFDFSGRTSPRRDLMGFIRLLRKLEMRAWIRPLPPIPGLVNEGRGEGDEQAWLKQLQSLLATQTATHGGPVAWVEGRAGFLGLPAPPVPVTTLSAKQSAAVIRSRAAIAAAHGSLLWTDVEDALYPAGWAANPATLVRKGAVGLNGEERPATIALRRDAALLRSWSALLSGLRVVRMPRPLAGSLPESITARELASPPASAVSISNSGTKPFHDDLRVLEPGTKRVLAIPGVSVAPGESLWLPVGLSLSPDGLCRDCTLFAPTEHIVYATVELLSIEFENGILAMEFAAPQPGEVILQLAREPVGPFLAAGHPAKFDFDAQTLRARLKIPAGKAPDWRVRVGLAIEAPDTSAFFNEAKRLIIGRKNRVSTVYSSEDVAKRSRLRVPEGFTATRVDKSPNEIDYEVAVPADALHGDYANLAIEADGVHLGRARLQMFHPASVHLTQSIALHLGAMEITPEPPVGAIDSRAGGNLAFSLRNNSTGIQTYRLEASGEGLEFLPAKTEIVVGAMEERQAELRVFARQGTENETGLRDFHLRIANGADLDLPMRVLLTQRGRTVVWSADLDGDGVPEWVLESSKVRAVFSERDGGRWIELTWKATNANFLPEGGVFASTGPVGVRANGSTLEIQGKSWKRTVNLSEGTITVDQTTALPAETLVSGKRGNATLTVTRSSGTHAVYAVN